MVKKIIAFAMTLVIGAASVSAPVMAEPTDGGTGGALGSDKANILTECAAAEDGIQCILQLVIDIMSVGVGVLAFIGIGISGIQYLTAGGSEEKTRKAKNRIFEIVIGLALYVLIYAILRWLLPGFSMSGSSGS
jgi:hypothetical protein